jgi:hypothetical protein
MVKITCPNEQYSGISASVTFVNGVGETEDPRLIEWFEERGYTVEGVEKEPETPQDPPPQDPEKPPYEGMSVEELKQYAEDNGIDIGNATSENGIIKKIKEAAEAKA